MQPRGFTMIELLVAIAIIGILAAIVLTELNSSRTDALEARTQQQLRHAQLAMEMLYLDSGLYSHKMDTYCPPINQANNEVALDNSAAGLLATDGSYTNWDGPYITEVTDPWGNPYYLDEDYYCTAGALGCNGRVDVAAPGASVIVSCGQDGMTGDDLSNPQPDNGIGCAYNDDNIVHILCFAP